MRICSRCGLSGDENSFFPPNSNQKWCRLCVDEIVESKRSKRKTKVETVEREQRAVRNLVAQLQEDGQPFVYLIEGPGGYKIGCSTNVAKRICQLNTSFSVTCKLIAVAPGNRDLERSLHHKHRFKRLNREWFSQSPAILNSFKELKNVAIFLPGYMNSEPLPK